MLRVGGVHHPRVLLVARRMVVDSMLRLIFVCSGNLCRSPMAAKLAEKKLAEARVDAVVTSAGTLGIQGQRAPMEAEAAMAEIGLSLEGHRSQGVSTMLLRSATHVVVMTPGHESEVLRREPSALGKVRRLWEFAGEPLEEIDDPVGGGVEDFRACRITLERCVENLLAALRAQ